MDIREAKRLGLIAPDQQELPGIAHIVWIPVIRQPQSPQAVVPVQNGFRDALLRLFFADEAQLSETVEMANLTGDFYLLRAARMVA